MYTPYVNMVYTALHAHIKHIGCFKKPTVQCQHFILSTGLLMLKVCFKVINTRIKQHFQHTNEQHELEQLA